MARRYLFGAASAAVVGTAISEAAAFATDSHTGVIESYISGHDTVAGVVVDMVEREFGNNTVSLPSNVVLAADPLDINNHSLMRDGEILAEGLTFDPDGSLSDASIDKLNNIDGVEATSSVERYSEFETTDVSTNDYINNHPDQFTNKKLEFWYDNDTTTIFEKNEQLLMLDRDGDDIVYSMEQMKKDGSSHGGLTADAMKLAGEGKLRMLIALSRDTQSEVFSVPINESGKAVMPSHVAEKCFEIGADGEPKFLGRFAEAAEVVKTEGNTEHVRILATDEGDGLKTVKDAIEIVGEKHKTVIDIVPKPEEVSKDYDAPYAIPVMGRTPLEKTNRAEQGEQEIPSAPPVVDKKPEEVVT